MIAVTLLNPRDSQILQLLRDGAPIQRVIDIGRHRRSWTPVHVGTVVAYHLDHRPALTVVPPPEPPTPPGHGDMRGYRRHVRNHDTPCKPCAQARAKHQREYRAKSREVEPPLPEWRPQPFNGTPADVELTAAQIAVLDQLCRGLTNGRIGHELGITEDTVKSHMKAVAEALGAKDRVHAVVLVMSGQVRVYERQTGKKAAS